MRARTSTPDDAKRVTMQVSTVGIVCNAALTVFKLVAGIVAHSSAIVADAVHSASDILGSLIVMIGAVFFPTRRPMPATPTGTKSSSASRPSCWATSSWSSVPPSATQA